MENATENKELISKLIALGFRFFPLVRKTKVPAVKNFTKGNSHNDLELILSWLKTGYALALYTGETTQGEWFPVVVDIDIAKGKRGLETVATWEKEGKLLPKTLTQKTASGGTHLIYKSKTQLRGKNSFALGVDIKARGGYIVCAPTSFEKGSYVFESGVIPPMDAPDWLVEALAKAPVKEETVNTRGAIDQEEARKRVVELLKRVPLAVEGSGGNSTFYAVACRVKDEGADFNLASELILEHYNPLCSPPFSDEEALTLIKNAYKYGVKPVGIATPEVAFSGVEPEAKELEEGEKEEDTGAVFRAYINKYNKRYAFMSGFGRVLDMKDTSFLDLKSFKLTFSGDKIATPEGKQLSMPDYWLNSGDKRLYSRFEFNPQTTQHSENYNLWQGFRIKPADSAKHDAVEFFKEHIFENVCDGRSDHADWIFSFFAHIFQKPHVKPLCALSIFGGKGTGKSAIAKWVGYLLGKHYLSTSQRRHLLGNFNSHLENLLLFNLEEAFWSGDKQGEGVLKDLITGGSQLIERKGHEAYEVKNFMRIMICTNERWSFPASADERRLAIFEITNKRQRDNRFFQNITDLLEGGGYSHLLRFFLDYDLSETDLNTAPHTAMLEDQKEESLPLFQSWWLACLEEGKLCGSFIDEWPTELRCQEVIAAYCSTLRGTRTVYASDNTRVGRQIKTYTPLTITRRHTAPRNYVFPPLSECRENWDKYMGFKRKWDE